MNRFSRYGLLLALPVLLLSHTAAAQAPERIALHPCVITGGKKADTSGIEAVCTTAAIRPTMDLVPSVDVLKFFQDEACATSKDRAACVAKLNAPPAKGSRERETRTCAKAKNRDACLGRLAAATQASRTLYITVNPYTPKVTRITGIVVDTTGKRVEDRSMELPRLASQSPSDAVRFAVGQMLDKLEVAKAPLPEVLPPSLTPTAEPEPLFVQPPAAEPTPPPAATPAPAPAPVVTQAPPPPPGRTWKTPAGITGMALGAVGAGVAGYFFSSASKDADRFNPSYADGNLPQQSEVPGLAAIRDDYNSKRSTAMISAGAGGALLVGGAILWLIDRPSDTPKEKTAGTTRLLAGPGQVGILVVLP